MKRQPGPPWRSLTTWMLQSALPWHRRRCCAACGSPPTRPPCPTSQAAALMMRRHAMWGAACCSMAMAALRGPLHRPGRPQDRRARECKCRGGHAGADRMLRCSMHPLQVLCSGLFAMLQTAGGALSSCSSARSCCGALGGGTRPILRQQSPQPSSRCAPSAQALATAQPAATPIPAAAPSAPAASRVHLPILQRHLVQPGGPEQKR